MGWRGRGTGGGGGHHLCPDGDQTQVDMAATRSVQGDQGSQVYGTGYPLATRGKDSHSPRSPPGPGGTSAPAPEDRQGEHPSSRTPNSQQFENSICGRNRKMECFYLASPTTDTLVSLWLFLCGHVGNTWLFSCCFCIAVFYMPQSTESCW